MNQNARFLLEAANLKAVCEKFQASSGPDQSEFLLETKLEDLTARWDRLQAQYNDVCSAPDAEADVKTTTQSTYENCYELYLMCKAQIRELIHVQRSSHQLLSSTTLPQTVAHSASQYIASTPNDVCIKVPPCDTEVFYGGYEEWPSFRDMFSAVYGTHPRLTPVQKLYHLRNKTKGQAGALVKNYPLRGENFQLAWDALMGKYENKRVLVDSQLKVLFDLPAATEESSEILSKIQSTVNDCLTTLRNQQVPVDNWDPILLYLVSTKLPSETMTQWEQSLASHKELPRWSQMDSFLTNRYEIVERLSSLKKGKPQKSQAHVEIFNTTEQPAKGCKLCGSSHGLRQCSQFMALSVTERMNVVLAFKCCTNCLAYTHLKKDCPSKFSCMHCKKPHHTLLHLDYTQSKIAPTNSPGTGISAGTQTIPPPSFELPSTSRAQANLAIQPSYTLLPTALAHIEHLGETFVIRALIDQGSQKSFLAAKVQKRLQLPTQATSVDVFGMGGKKIESAKLKCSFNLRSRVNDFQIRVTTTLLSKLTSTQPAFSITSLNLQEVSTLELADPNCWCSGQIDMVIGADLLPDILLNGIQKNILGHLLAQNTVFGWILSGPLDNANSSSLTSFSTIVAPPTEENLNDLLKQFWEQEEVPESIKLSAEDEYCEQYFQQTTYRQPDGRFVVKLPFKPEFPQTIALGASKHIATQQWKRMEHTLTKDPPLQKEYTRVLAEYLTLGHMSEAICAEEEIHGGKYYSYYLPHHAVTKPDSTTTKVRVVFNASRTTTSNSSLNDVLCTGPTLQADIVLLLLNWRLYRYVFNGDIENMYRQILIHPSDRKFQRILFRMSPSDPLCEYELQTITFGVKPAPYLAIRCLHRLALESKTSHPLAAAILQSESYVDDILSGGHTLLQAEKALAQVIETLDSAGFPLRKITANHPDILQHFPAEHLLQTNFLQFEDTSAAKMLGIRWNALFDCFSYQLQPLTVTEGATKRQILSAIAKLYDPAGWLAPVIIHAKIFMQSLWLEGTDWDECVKPDNLMKWQTFLEALPHIENIRIPRWDTYAPEAFIQIHGFCDASEQAFCAALYIRTQNSQRITSHLLISKTKVAPLKIVSLPRLELNGAVLLSKLIKTIIPQLKLSTASIHLYTDSSIVLSWLAKPPHVWKTFVANRISQILDNVHNTPWNHIKSGDNPADLGTRGCSPRDLVNNSLWWNGPKWLIGPPEEWPISTPHAAEPGEQKVAFLATKGEENNWEITHVEEQEECTVHTTIVEQHEPLSEFSSYSRALRVLAYRLRFLHNTLPKHQPHYNYSTRIITQAELNAVKMRLILLAQKEHYSIEYQCLEKGQPIGRKSSLLPLNPFLDRQKLMRVNGRLVNSELAYDARCPIILPTTSRLCTLFVQFIHELLMHADLQLMARMIRQQFFIPRLKSKIKGCVARCKTCIIFKQRLQSQIMAALPSERVQYSLPFTVTGIDFAGPFDIKSAAIRNAPYLKGYACVFVCFSTKAIHLEACSELSTAAFRAAFDRFIGRRGLPHKVVSDNGRNFVGASSAFRNEYESFLSQASETSAARFAPQGFEWHFIPPNAPHMGGLWEAAVKSFKNHFFKVAGAHRFTFEEFTTLLVRIEGVLNSRPLTPMSEDVSDPLALTPGHFLRGAPLTAPPEIPSDNLSLVNRWEKIKVLHHRFSQRWKDEYLATLHKRYKWQHPQRNLQLGDLVIVKEELIPPQEWRLGRIVHLYTGPDGHSRVADIRTQLGEVTRPIVKLCCLPPASSSTTH